MHMIGLLCCGSVRGRDALLVRNPRSVDRERVGTSGAARGTRRGPTRGPGLPPGSVSIEPRYVVKRAGVLRSADGRTCCDR